MNENLLTAGAEDLDAPSTQQSAGSHWTALSTQSWTDSTAVTPPPNEPLHLTFHNPFTTPANPELAATQDAAVPVPVAQDRPANGAPVARPGEQGAPAAPRPEPLTAAAIDGLITGLNSSSFAVRDNAQRQLERAGVAALPAVMSTMRQEGISLEVRRRCELFCNSLVNSGVENLLTGVRSNNPAVSQASELFLSRQSTDSLLSGSTHSQLSAENRQTFNRMIRTRLNDQQLEQLAGVGNGDKLIFGAAPPDENTARRSLAASEVLGRPNPSANFQLGTILMARGGTSLPEAERRLTQSLQGAQNQAEIGSAQQLLAGAAFRRGDTARGLSLAQDSLRSLNVASGQQHWNPAIAEQLRALGAVATAAPLTNPNLNAEQRQQLRDLSTQSGTSATAHDVAVNQFQQRILGGKKP